jgi:UrcA family protein
MKTLFLACTSVLALTTSLANATAAIEEAPQQLVDYSDLDLANDAGADALMERIRAAARVVCRMPAVESMTLDSFLRARRCREIATAQAIERVDATSLTRLGAESTSAPTSESPADEVPVRITHDRDAATPASLTSQIVARYVRPSRK